MIDRGRHNLLGVEINAIDDQAALQTIMQAARSRAALGVTALAVHGVMTGVLDKTHRYRLNRLELVVPDGQPVRWGLNWLHGTRLRERVYGPDLMLATCRAACAAQLPVFFYGGTPSLLDELTRNLLKQFPDLQIAGSQPSRFRQLSSVEKQQVVDDILQSGAGITFVGLGCPRQEVWVYEFKNQLGMPVLAVGAAFAIHAGELKQAPRWMRNMGLEWFYRLKQEPKRLWKRYLILNPYFVCLLLLQKIGLARFNPCDTVPPSEEILYG